MDFSIRRKRFISVVNPSKTKGSALLHYVGHVVSTANKRVEFRSLRMVSLGGGRLGRIHAGVNVVFRRCGLIGQLSMVRGALRKGLKAGSALTKILKCCDGRRGRRTIRVLGILKLGRVVCGHTSRLDNKRGRQINVTHTLVRGPQVLLYSRPVTSLSPGSTGIVVSRLGGISAAVNVAIIIGLRRMSMTVGCSSEVVNVGGKRMICGKSTGNLASRSVRQVCKSRTRSLVFSVKNVRTN